MKQLLLMNLILGGLSCHAATHFLDCVANTTQISSEIFQYVVLADRQGGDKVQLQAQLFILKDLYEGKSAKIPWGKKVQEEGSLRETAKGLGIDSEHVKIVLTRFEDPAFLKAGWKYYGSLNIDDGADKSSYTPGTLQCR